MRNLILAIVLICPSLVMAGPLLDAIAISEKRMGPIERAIALASSNVEVFEIATTSGSKVLLQLEQPSILEPEKKLDVDLSTGPILRPDVGCKLSTCGMCVLNSLANHGQSYDYLKTLTNTEQMRLHYRLHNESGFEGTVGTVQCVTNSSGGVRTQKKGPLRRLFGK
ncbi:hypothetical protein LCGC14_0248880 [marine sediment metagenome]|uniref:Uncharacterized protein n=1 Tax=marine sediment metagenome TaxID=412755 RepID=A0A0F9WQ76_9ZZZZ